MPAILEIPEVRERVSPLSVEDYHLLGEYNENGKRTELIRGIILEKRAKSPLHGKICSRFYKQFLAQLPAGYSVWKEEPLTLIDSEPEPDIAVTQGDEKSLESVHPSTAELLVEVAVSKPELDRENAALYAEAGVKEYWIVLGNKQQLEVYREPKAGKFQKMLVFGLKDTIQCEALPKIKIRVAELFS
jgi:Uma2 family endonuclease